MTKKGKLAKLLDLRLLSLVIALVIFLVIGYLSEFTNFRPFRLVEATLRDYYLKSKANQVAVSYQEGVTQLAALNPNISDKIVIIGIDNEALQDFGRWPWPRSVQARVLQSLARISDQQSRERAVLLDIFYTVPSDPSEDAVLYNSILENGRLFLENTPDWNFPATEDERERIYAVHEILETSYGSLKNIKGDWQKLPYFLSDEPPLPVFAAAIKGYGHAQFSADSDEVYRRARLVARFSRLVAERQAPLEGLQAVIRELNPDPQKHEWLAYADPEGNFHNIDPFVIQNEAAWQALKKEIEAKALPDKDADGNIAYRLRFFRDSFFPSIVLSLALEYYHKTPAEVEVVLGQYIRIPNPEEYVLDATGLGQWQPLRREGRVLKEMLIPIDEEGMMIINFMGASSENSKTYPVFSFSKFALPEVVPDVNTGPESWPISRGMANKLIIVCAYSKGMAQDEKMTPFGLMYGGEIHANALNTILMHNFITPAPVWLSLLVLLAAILLAAFTSSRLPPLYSLFLAIWLIAVYFLAVDLIFESSNFVLNFTAPAVGIFFTFLSVVAYRVIFEEQDKRRIKSTFTKYVSASVVEQLLINPPELGGVDKEITVLFSDIRGYTSLSETMTPQALINHLNLYLTKMTDTLMAYEGTLDKYVGDMVMCFWGAPLPQKNHAILACKCALKMLEELARLNEGWPPEKRIDIGIGINSGIMTVGNMGSPVRMNYTLIGDNVNLGSRLEGTNKEYGTHIIISEYTYGLVKDRVIARELDNIRVKGKNKPVLIYELIDVKDGLDPTPDLEA